MRRAPVRPWSSPPAPLLPGQGAGASAPGCSQSSATPPPLRRREARRDYAATSPIPAPGQEGRMTRFVRRHSGLARRRRERRNRCCFRSFRHRRGRQNLGAKLEPTVTVSRRCQGRRQLLSVQLGSSPDDIRRRDAMATANGLACRRSRPECGRSLLGGRVAYRPGYPKCLDRSGQPGRGHKRTERLSPQNGPAWPRCSRAARGTALSTAPSLAIAGTSIPCADSSTICARRQVTTDPLPRRTIRTSCCPSSSSISRTRSRPLTGPVSRISVYRETAWDVLRLLTWDAASGRPGLALVVLAVVEQRWRSSWC